MNFLWVTMLFLLYIGYSYAVKRMLREENEKRKKVSEEIMPIVNEQETKYNLKSAPFLNLRIMSIFLRVEDEKERETLRERLLANLETAKMNPVKYLTLNLSKFVIFTLILYATLFFFKEEPNVVLSYVTLGVIALGMILKKNYVLMVLIVGLGYLFYPQIPATMMLLLLLNRLWHLFKK